MVRHIQKFSKSFTRAEKISSKRELIEHRQQGNGLFIFRNKSRNATLRLPKPGTNGETWVDAYNPKIPGSGEWQGDSYFLSMIPTEAVLVKTLRSQDEDKKMNEEKLILDQPDMVTNKGKVEHVVANPRKVLTETPVEENAEVKDVLLTEDPLDGITILRG